MGRLLCLILLGFIPEVAAQPPGDGSGGGNGQGPGQQPTPPPPVEVMISGTLSLTGSSNVKESQDALRGLNLGLSLQSAFPVEFGEQEIDVKLDIRDDQGDPARCRSLYEDMLQEYWQQGEGFQIFLGPISERLSQEAANVTIANEQLLVLPFASLPAVQAAQSPVSVFSLDVPAKELLKMPVFQVAQGGAKTLAIWADPDLFYTEMCDGAVAEAKRLGMELVFQRDLSSSLFLLEQARQIAASRPDVLVVCQDYRSSVEVMVTLDFIHFQPNALIIWDSGNPEFYAPLLVANGVDILGADLWSNRQESCGADCATVTRAEFFERYENLHGEAPSLYAGQAAAAGIAATYLVRHAFSQSVLDVAEEAQKTDLLSTEMRDQNAPKGSFYHPLTFNNNGYLISANIDVTQLTVLNNSATTTVRRLQQPPGPGGTSTAAPSGAPSGAPNGPTGPQPQAAPVLIAPITTEQLLAFTTLQPTVRGVYAFERDAPQITAEAYESNSAIVYPRLLEEKREVLQYPCSLGFEVRTQKLWGMINVQRRNLTDGPISPCEPCDRGYFRSAIGSTCDSCAVGTQATQAAQSECTECLQGTVCHPAATARTVAPGFHEAYGLLLPCAVPERCLGENMCLGNSKGVRCSRCNSGYATDPTRATVEADPCRPCDEEWAKEYPRLIMEIGVYLLLYVVLLLAHWSSCVSMMSTSCFILRAAVNHLQFMAITLKATSPEFIASTIKNTQGYFVWMSSLILDPVNSFPIECLSSTWQRYQVKAVLGLTIIPAVIVTALVLSVIWEFIFGPLLLVVCPPNDGEEDAVSEDGIGHHMSFKKKGKSVHHSASLGLVAGSPSITRCLSRVVESSLIWCHLLLPMAVFNLLDVLRCVDPKDEAVGVIDYPRPIQVQVDDFGVQCGGGDHSLWTILAIAGIALYGIGVPAGMVALIQALFQQDSWKSHRAFGYMLDGSSSDYIFVQIGIMFVMVLSLALANLHFIPLIFRVTWLLSLYCVYSLVISDVVPFDARDKTVLLKLELCSMVGQMILLSGFLLKSGAVQLLNSMPGEIVEIPWVFWHFLFLFFVVSRLFNNLVLKRIRYCDSLKDLTYPEQFLYDVLGVEKDKVVLDVASGILDLRGLTPSSRQTLQVTMSLALERYFKAASEGVVPWTEVCDPKQSEDAEPERDVLDPARPGQLHTGFLSAAIYESLVEVEASRELHRLQERSNRRQGLFSQFLKADAREPTVDMESIQGDFCHGGQIRRGKVEAEIKQKPELKATSEEMYMAMSLLLKSILKGHPDLYDLQKKHRSQRTAAQGDEERSIQDILEEVSTKQGEFEEEDLSQEGSDIFEVPEPELAAEEAERPVPALLRIRTEVPRPDDHPNAALARTLGIRHVSNVQDNLTAMQEMHDQKYHEIMELRAEIQGLHRSLAEAEARYAQMEREATTNNQSEAVSSTTRTGPTGKVASVLSSPRTPRNPPIHGKGIVSDYECGDENGRVRAKYPFEKWTSSKRSRPKRRQQEVASMPLAANLKESTIPVEDNSFWSKATT